MIKMIPERFPIVVLYATGGVTLILLLAFLLKSKFRRNVPIDTILAAQPKPELPGEIQLAFSDYITNLKLRTKAYFLRSYAFNELPPEQREKLLNDYPVIQGLPVLNLKESPALAQVSYQIRQQLLSEYLSKEQSVHEITNPAEVVSNLVREAAEQDARKTINSAT